MGGEVAVGSEHAWRVARVTALALLPVCVLAVVALAVRYGALAVVPGALLVPNVLVGVMVLAERMLNR